MQCGMYYLFVLFCHRYPQHQRPSTRRKMLCSFVEQRTMQTTRSPLQCRCWIFVSTHLLSYLYLPHWMAAPFAIPHCIDFVFVLRNYVNKFAYKCMCAIYIKFTVFLLYFTVYDTKFAGSTYSIETNAYSLSAFQMQNAGKVISYASVIYTIYKTQIIQNGTKAALTVASILNV